MSQEDNTQPWTQDPRSEGSLALHQGVGVLVAYRGLCPQEVLKGDWKSA